MSGEGPAPVGSAAPVTPPEWVLSLPWLCVQGKQSTSWLCLQTHISIAAGAMGSMQNLWTWKARALSLQSPEHSPFSSQAGEIQLSNSCDSTHGLWLRGLSGQDVLGHKLDKGTVADGAGNTSGSVGSACSPQEPARFGSLPSVFPANAQAQLQSCLTSDEFGPGLKMSVDVLLPHDKRAGV